jgi:hypothetical protein
MQTVVISIMVLAVWSVILKMTFCKTPAVWIVAVVSAVLIGSSWPWAVEQSKTQIADWLANPSLMADIAVLITVEVAVQMSFCVMFLSQQDNSRRKPLKRVLFVVLNYLPGILYFFVLFSLLVTLVFALPGVYFPVISWSLAAAVLLFVPLLVWLTYRLLPDESTRLEMLFLVNLLIALMGVIATVNGRTSMAGVNNVEWGSLLAVLAIVIVGATIGFFLRRLRKRNL